MARWQVIVTVTRSGLDPVTLRFDRTPLAIGAAVDNDIVLDGPHVSGRHATIVVTGGQLLYQDQSQNGSFLGGERIRERRLTDGDVITIQPFTVTFRLEVAEQRHTVPLEPVSLPLVEGFAFRLIKAPAALVDRVFTLAPGHGDAPMAVTVGRAADARICLNVESVSRRHATLMPAADGGWQVIDERSRNGVAVNGVKRPHAHLHPGDEVAFGPDVTARYERVTPPAAASPAGPVAVADPATGGSADASLQVVVRRSVFDGAVVVVDIRGRVDGYSYSGLRDRLTRIIDAGDHLLLLDFSDCVFCDHVGLGVIVSVKAALDKRRGALCLIHVSERLREGLTLLRLNALLAIEPDESAGVRRLLR